VIKLHIIHITYCSILYIQIDNTGRKNHSRGLSVATGDIHRRTHFMIDSNNKRRPFFSVFAIFLNRIAPLPSSNIQLYARMRINNNCEITNLQHGGGFSIAPHPSYLYSSLQMCVMMFLPWIYYTSLCL